MIVVGEIEKIETNIAFVVVAEHETTYECFMMQPLTGKIKIDLPYSVGDQVVAYLQDGRNIVLGAVYNDVDVRDSEAEFEKVLIQSKKITTKTSDETKMRASKFDIANNQGDTERSLWVDFIAEVQKIIVLQGTSPNVGALEAIKTKAKRIFK